MKKLLIGAASLFLLVAAVVFGFGNMFSKAHAQTTSTAAYYAAFPAGSWFSVASSSACPVGWSWTGPDIDACLNGPVPSACTCNGQSAALAASDTVYGGPNPACWNSNEQITNPPNSWSGLTWSDIDACSQAVSGGKAQIAQAPAATWSGPLQVSCWWDNVGGVGLAGGPAGSPEYNGIQATQINWAAGAIGGVPGAAYTYDANGTPHLTYGYTWNWSGDPSVNGVTIPNFETDLTAAGVYRIIPPNGLLNSWITGETTYPSTISATVTVTDSVGNTATATCPAPYPGSPLNGIPAGNLDDILSNWSQPAAFPNGMPTLPPSTGSTVSGSNNSSNNSSNASLGTNVSAAQSAAAVTMGSTNAVTVTTGSSITLQGSFASSGNVVTLISNYRSSNSSQSSGVAIVSQSSSAITISLAGVGPGSYELVASGPSETAQTAYLTVMQALPGAANASSLNAQIAANNNLNQTNGSSNNSATLAGLAASLTNIQSMLASTSTISSDILTGIESVLASLAQIVQNLVSSAISNPPGAYHATPPALPVACPTVVPYCPNGSYTVVSNGCNETVCNSGTPPTTVNPLGVAGSATNSNGLSSINSAPVIMSVSPSVAAPGATITITGSNFMPNGNVAGGNVVSFYDPNIIGGNKTAWGINPLNSAGNNSLGSSNNDTVIQFVVPSQLSAGVYPLNVMNHYGNSNDVNFTVVSSGASSGSAQGVYISSISPSSGSAGTTLTITGNGFSTTGNTVNFCVNPTANGTPPPAGFAWSTVTVGSANGTTLQAQFPSLATSTSGNCIISVQNANGFSNLLNFKEGTSIGIGNPPAGSSGIAATLTGITPNSGPVGTQITVIGTGFAFAGNQVLIGGNVAATVGSANGTSLIFAIPNTVPAYCASGAQGSCGTYALGNGNPAAYTFTVNNGVGPSNALTLTVTGGYVATTVPGKITDVTIANNPPGFVGENVFDASFSADTNVTGENDPISLSGTGAPAGTSFTTTAQNTLSLIGIPTQAGTFTISVTATDTATNSSVTKQFTITITPQVPPPVLSSLTPSSGPVGTTVTINGTSFSATGNTVYVNECPAYTNVNSNGTSITFTVPTSYNSTYQCNNGSLAPPPTMVRIVPPAGLNIQVSNIGQNNGETPGVPSNILGFTVTGQ